MIKQEQKELACFVIMPFSQTNFIKNGENIIISLEEWNFVFQDWIKKAVESYPHCKILCKRSPSVSGNFVKGIVKDLSDSDITIADITGSKPNVYYELGIRHAISNGTIIITQDLESIPSDLNSYYTFGYTYTDKAFKQKKYYEQFEQSIHNKIDHILENNFPSDNPVSDFSEPNSKGAKYSNLTELHWQEAYPNKYFIQEGSTLKILNIDQLMYLKAERAYSKAHLINGRKIEFLRNLSQLEDRIQSRKFIRIHRSYIINMDFIEALEGNDIILEGNIPIPVGNSYASIIRKMFGPNLL